MGANLVEIYTKQEEREAKDDDSNFSAESFKRKKRRSTKVRKTSGYGRDITKPGVDLKLTPLELYEDDDMSRLMEDINQSNEMLSKNPSSKRLDEAKSLTMNPSKKSLVSNQVSTKSAKQALQEMPSQFSFTRSVGDKIMRNPV